MRTARISPPDLPPEDPADFPTIANEQQRRDWVAAMLAEEPRPRERTSRAYPSAQQWEHPTLDMRAGAPTNGQA